LWVVLSLVVSLGVMISIPHLPPIVVAGALAVVLTLVGLSLWFRPKAHVRPSELDGLKRELMQTRRGYERLFTAVPCFICVQDRDHQILEANALYRTEFGATDRSLCYQVCKGRRTRCPDCIVDLTFSDGQVHSSDEILITQDGRRISAVVHTTPIYDDDGQLTSVMEVFTDITEVKKLQRQLALMGRAVAGMAHRVKNILMGLEGGIFVVNEGLKNGDREAAAEGWEMVQRNVELVSRIVKDLLYCSKERTPSFRSDVCPQEIVTEVHRLFVDRLAKENIDLEIDLEKSFHTGTFDPDGLHNLLCNLVANAVDACRFDQSEDKPRHSITLSCRRNGDESTTFEVVDDGPGIPDELNGKVFEDFFSTKGSEGTGIGLLVAQKVAEDHGGKVSFRSPPSGGSVFTVTIPTGARTESSSTAG
jgi:PAS domain S-box-containing protein